MRKQNLWKSILCGVFMTIGIVGFVANSCQKDDCSKVFCQNGGYCFKGKCECPEGFIGTDCSKEIVPKKMVITRIEVIRFPATKPNGAGWDLSDGADIMPILSIGNKAVWTSETYYPNATPNQTYIFNPNPYIELENPTNRYTLDLYDLDGASKEWMGGIIFTPYYTGGGFPSIRKLDVDGGDVAFRIHLKYFW